MNSALARRKDSCVFGSCELNPAYSAATGGHRIFYPVRMCLRPLVKYQCCVTLHRQAGRTERAGCLEVPLSQPRLPVCRHFAILPPSRLATLGPFRICFGPFFFRHHILAILPTLPPLQLCDPCVWQTLPPLRDYCFTLRASSRREVSPGSSNPGGLNPATFTQGISQDSFSPTARGVARPYRCQLSALEFLRCCSTV